MRKRLLAALLAIGMVCLPCLSGCSDNVPDSGSYEDQDEEDEDSDEDEDDENEIEDDETDEDNEVISEETPIPELDYYSSDSILSFACGSWTLVDQNTGSAYGKLEINKYGDCKFTQSDTGKSCKGTISFIEDPTERLAGIHGYLIEFENAVSGSDVFSVGNSSEGRFMISQSTGRDYLFLEEIGNGGSNIAYEIFRSPDRDEFDFDEMMQWIFVRDNDVTSVDKPEKNARFYARAMEFTGEGFVLQRVMDVDFESEYEYTGFKFLGAVFDESTYQGAAYYKLNADADLSGVLHETELTRPYPETIYTVYTDSKGNIEAVRDVEKAYYGDYELYSLEQDVDFDFDSFSVNDYEFDIQNFLYSDANAIVDCEVTGDILIITSHINPHSEEYTIYNMRSGWFEKRIIGCNFLYDEHVWDSFYSYMDTVYDYEGREIYTVDGTEISSLSFSDDGSQIEIEYWKSDYEDTYEVTIDRPECLNAPTYALADFKRHPCAYTWDNFISYAPEDAIAMIMVNPHSDDTWDFCMPMNVDDNPGLDNVYVVALQDMTLFSCGNSDYTCERGEIISYGITVSESAPLYTVYISTLEKDAEWPATIISGKDDIRYIFV